MRHPEKLRSRLALVVIVLCVILFGTHTSSAGVVRPLTDLKVDDTSNGVIAADGTVVFAGSNADPLGLNPMHGQQVFSWALPGVTQAQVTTLLRGAGADSVSDDGAWVSAISRADPVGQNHDAGQELFLISSDGSTINQLTNDATFDGGTLWLSRISGSGNRVVFTSNRDPLGGNPGNYPQLFIVDANGSNLTQLTSAAADVRFFSFSISDDGTRIVFDYSGDLTGGNADGTSEIFTVLNDATALQQKTTSATVDSFGPSLSGNGQLIVFVDTGGIRVMLWPSTNSIAIAAGEGPSITDDGKWLYYTAPDADNEEIFVVSSSGGTPTQLTFTSPPLVNSFPVVSGGNVRLTFMVREGAYPGGSNSDGGTELMVMDVDGSNVVQLSNDVVTGGDAFPNMSPDGTRIVLASTGDLTGSGTVGRRTSEIFRIDDDGSNLAQITTDAAVWHPTVTADGATIAFMSREDPTGDSTCSETPLNPQIFSIQSEGTGLTPIVPVSNCTGADHPRISADGNFILLQSTGNFAGAGGSGAPLFRVPPEGGTVSLVVDDGNNLIKVPLLSDDGQWVVYHSATNVDGLNPDNSTEIFRARTDGTLTERITADPTYSSTRPDTSADGGLVVYSSRADPLGTNADHNAEIFLYDAGTTATQQLTTTTVGGNHEPLISGNGAYVYFVSSTPYFETLIDESSELYRVTVSTGRIERATGLRYGSRSFTSTGWRNSLSFAVDHTGRAVFSGAFLATFLNFDTNSQTWIVDFDTAARIHVGRAAPTLVTWDVEPQPVRYDVIRGNVANLQPGAGNTVDLGPVICVEDDSPDNTTAGFEDVDQPSQGEVFFYVFRGSQGVLDGPGSWGQASDGAERVAGAGSCQP